jgi:hypothetical protein
MVRGMKIYRSMILAAGLAGLAACAQAPAGGIALEAASTTGLDQPLLFDAAYYAAVNPDLQAAFGADAAALRTHWLTHGVAEGRRASPAFDCQLYLALYGDLAAAFGTDCAAAMTHFRDTGLPREGRRGSVELDVRTYLATYADLVAAFGATGFAAAGNHFVTQGLPREGRAGSAELDVAYYVCHTADLTTAFAGDYRAAAAHWARQGLASEGRRGAVHFDVQRYLANYADLRAAFGTRYGAAMTHWLVHGKGEGRTGDPGDGGGGSPLCASGTPVDLHATTTTSAQGFPTAWFGFPIPDGPLGYAGINGAVSVTNSTNIYSEVLFIVGYLPAGNCIAGAWPASTPEFGPPGMVGITNLIVKAPTAGTYRSPANFPLPGEAAISHCLMIGLNGGTVAAPHPVTSTSDLTLRYAGAPTGPAIMNIGGEFCFGQSWGCQRATTNTALSFANVTAIGAPHRLIALFGNISDSTFDGSATFGAPPAGAWTAHNDVYVYHAAACAALGATGGLAGPANFYGQIPADAIHVLSAPISGNRIGAQAVPVFQPLSVPLVAGDCLVTLYGLSGGGGFDNESQIQALLE